MKDLLSKKHLEEISRQLSDILKNICEIENILNKDILDNELELHYTGNLKYKNINFNGMTYKQINSILEYEKQNSNYQERLFVDNLIDNILNWFYDRLLETSCVLKNPISYELANEMDNLMFLINNFNSNYYLISKDIIFSKKQLNNLKINVINNIHQVKNSLHSIEKKLEGMYSDSEYIKRNKK